MAKEPGKVCFYDNILMTIGRTPLVRLHRVTGGARGLILAKMESFNPGRSVKDRIGVTIIEEAERSGRLKPGGKIVEATSGNTGMGLALAAAVKGYRTVFTLPDKMSMEKVRLLRAFGAEVIVTPTAVPHGSPESYTEVAKRVVRESGNAILADQYENPVNPEAHYRTTGPEIWEQTGGQIDYFVCGIGTGGTITGTAKYLKEKNPDVRIVGVDPKGSVFREYYYTGKVNPQLKTYKVEGIGQDHLPGVLDFDVIDEIVEVDDRESFLTARRLTREEGLMVGGSSGTAVAGLLRIAPRFKEDDVVVVLLPDSGERYLSKIFDDDWMREHGFLVPDRITASYVLRAKRSEELIATTPAATVRSALDLFRTHDISQIPVIDNGKAVGGLHDHSAMLTVLERPEVLEQPVGTIMGPSFPRVSAAAPVEEVIHLMSTRDNYAVLVEENGAIAGILTRYDVIEFMER